MNGNSSSKNGRTSVSRNNEKPSILAIDAPGPALGGSESQRIENIEEMEEEEILSDDGFLRRKERSGMPLRIRSLGIRPAWWKEKKEEKLRRNVRVARARLNVWDSTPQTKNEPLELPLDIASCILSHIPDLETLYDAILISKTFASSFQAFRLSITRDVVINMFGSELFECVLMLAVTLAHTGPLKDEDGKIPLASPAPTAKLSSSVLRELVKIWRTTNVWVELWETKALWMGGSPGSAKRQLLSEESRISFVRAIVMFWVYSTCARNTLQHHKGYGGYSKGTLQNTGIFDYYSHIDLLRARAIFDHFESLIHIACDDCGLEGDDHHLYWQFYCASLGPLWMLRLLDHYDIGFEEAGDGEDEGFFFYHSEEEQESRGIDGMYAQFTGKSIENMKKVFERMGVDGTARPIDSQDRE